MPHVYFRPGIDDFAFRNSWRFTDFERRKIADAISDALVGATTDISKEVRAIRDFAESVSSVSATNLVDEIVEWLRENAGEEAEWLREGWRQVRDLLGSSAEGLIAAALGGLVDFVPETYGLCGGMAFASLDYFQSRGSRRIPRGDLEDNQPHSGTVAGETLRGYIWRRLLDSLKADGSRFLLWMGILHGLGVDGNGETVLAMLSRREFARIRARINDGIPCPLGLVGQTHEPHANHQVLAYGYEVDGRSARLFIYDSNAPGRESTIDFALTGSRTLNARESHPNARRGALRGFFASTWGYETPPEIGSAGAGNQVWCFAFDHQVRNQWSVLHPTDSGSSGRSAHPNTASLTHAARMFIAADFDGDGNDEIVVAPDVRGALGNHLWALQTHPSRWFSHYSHADMDRRAGWDLRCDVEHGKGPPARTLVAGDIDGDGRAELIVLPEGDEPFMWIFQLVRDGGGNWVWERMGGGWPGSETSGASARISWANVGVRFAVVGDFNGDGRDEVAFAAAGPRSSGNDFWVLGYDPLISAWRSVGQISGHPLQASIDLSPNDVSAKMAVAGDVDGDGRDELIIVPHVRGSAGNDLWVMRLAGDGSWQHFSQIRRHELGADVDLTTHEIGVRHVACGDIDGDGRDEVLALVEEQGSAANDVWVMKWDPASGTWIHLRTTHSERSWIGADLDAGTTPIEGRKLVVADFDGDGIDEVAIIPRENAESPNDVWVYKYFGHEAPGRWRLLGRVPGRGTSFRVEGLHVPIRDALAGSFGGLGARAGLAIILEYALW